MGILFRLVAYCDGLRGASCSARQEYESGVSHDGEADCDSMNGTGPLTASDVEHDEPLPDGWIRDFQARSFGTAPLLCPKCLREMRRGPLND